MRGGGPGPPKKEEKFPTRGGGSGEGGMVSQLLPVLNYDSKNLTQKLMRISFIV